MGVSRIIGRSANVLAQAGRTEEQGQTVRRNPALPAANCSPFSFDHLSADDEAGEQRASGQQSGSQIWRGDNAVKAGAGLLASEPREKELAAGAETKPQSV